jgi:hypothetical protein
MNYLWIFIPPIINLLVTGLFASVIVGQYIRRRRQHQLYWSLALMMAFLATLAYICMLIVQPTSVTGMFLFRIYYLFGASIMPAWLGLGSITLAGWKRLARILVGIVSFLSFIAIAFVFDATIDKAKLALIAGTPGAGIFQRGPWLVTMIALNTFGAVAVGGVALYSGWKLARRVPGANTGTILWANAYIFVGVLLLALAGSLAGFFGVEGTFWLIMAIGWILLFTGALLASRRSRVIVSVQLRDTEPGGVEMKQG